MAGIRIYTRFYDITGMPWAVTVWDLYTTPSTSLEIPMGAEPITIRWSGDDLKYIVGSEATLTYVTNEDMSWLRTATTDNFMVIVWKNPAITNGVWDITTYYTQLSQQQSTTLWWVGYILADTYTRELRIDPTYTIQATDRLGSLANYDYLDLTGTPVGEVSHGSTPTPTNRHQRMLTALANALQLAGVFLPIVSTINLFEEGISDDATDDPLDQLYVDELNFCDEDLALGDCYMVVDKIMRIFKSRIFQSGGFWFVQRLEDFKRPEVNYRVFTFSVGYPYSYNSTVNHVKTTNKTDFAVLFCASEETAPAYKKIEVVQTYGKLTSLFPGFTFEDQEFDVEDKPIHWQFSQQLGGLTSNFEKWMVGDNNVLLSKSYEENKKPLERGYLESPRIPLVCNSFDGLLLQMDIGHVWSEQKPTSWQRFALYGNINISDIFVKVFFIEDDTNDRWIYIKTRMSDPRHEDEEMSWYHVSDAYLLSAAGSEYSSIAVVAVESLENLQKVELFLPPLPSGTPRGKFYIQIIDPNTNYGIWGWDGHAYSYFVHLCVDNVILVYAPKADISLGPYGGYRYIESNTITTVINSVNRVNVSYPLDLGDAPSFTTDIVNKFQAYSGLLNTNSSTTEYTATSLWYEKYTTTSKIKTYSIGYGGIRYKYGDIITIAPNGDGLYFGGYVSAVSSPVGAVQTFTMESSGSGFTVGTYDTFTDGDGEGCTIVVTAVEDTSVTSASKSLADWIINDYAENETPSMMVRCSIRGAADYWNTVQFYTVSPTAVFLPQGVSFNIKTAIWEGNWIEIKGMMIPTEYTSEQEPRKSLQI